MHVIIPARYASTRLPGKPLLDIAGKPMIQHVYERACESGAQSVAIATDDARIREAAARFGARVCLTSTSHRSGTERLAEAIAQLGLGPDEIVVNLQGDEPLMPGGLIRRVAETLAARREAVVATACCAMVNETEFNNPNVAKVVCDKDGFALYFSRAPIPYPRDHPGVARGALRHIGIYAYRVAYVRRYVTLAPSPIEGTEQLEQLRVLWHGGRIAVYVTDQAPPAGVDTPEDLERVREYFSKK